MNNRETRWGDDDWPEDGLCMDCACDIPSGQLQCASCEASSLRYFAECARRDALLNRFAECRTRWGWLAYLRHPIGAIEWHCEHQWD